MVDSSAWPDTFFWVTMASVVVLNSELSKGYPKKFMIDDLSF